MRGIGQICKKISVFLLVIFFLAGCNSQTKDAIGVTEEPPQETKALENGEVEISIYGMDTETFELKDYVAVIPKKQMNAFTIVNEVVKVFAEGNIEIALDKVTQKSGNVYVSFKRSGVPVKGVSKKVEKVILDAISNSLLDNVENCEKVYFQIEGQKYETDNIQLDLETPYSW